MNIAKEVYRPDIYEQAAKALIAEGKLKASDFPGLQQDRRLPPHPGPVHRRRDL